MTSPKWVRVNSFSPSASISQKSRSKTFQAALSYHTICCEGSLEVLLSIFFQKLQNMSKNFWIELLYHEFLGTTGPINLKYKSKQMVPFAICYGIATAHRNQKIYIIFVVLIVQETLTIFCTKQLMN